MYCCRLLTSFKLNLFQNKKKNQEYYQIVKPTRKTAWIQIGTLIRSVLIWVQTDYKSYQQTTKVATSKERGNEVCKMVTNMFSWGACSSDSRYNHKAQIYAGSWFLSIY